MGKASLVLLPKPKKTLVYTEANGDRYLLVPKVRPPIYLEILPPAPPFQPKKRGNRFVFGKAYLTPA